MRRLCVFGSADLAAYAVLAASMAWAVALGPAYAQTTTAEDGLKEPSHAVSSTEYERAARSFPEFCRAWQRKLDEDAKNQKNLLQWQDRDGWKTATYSGYGPIRSCTCKLRDGVPLGRITYEEIEYYIAGRTVVEARNAQPIAAGSTNTIVILRWEKGRWNYK